MTRGKIKENKFERFLRKMFIHLVSNVRRRKNHFESPQDFLISPPDVPPSHRDSLMSHAIIRSICDTHPAYSYNTVVKSEWERDKKNNWKSTFNFHLERMFPENHTTTWRKSISWVQNPNFQGISIKWIIYRCLQSNLKPLIET